MQKVYLLTVFILIVLVGCNSTEPTSDNDEKQQTVVEPTEDEKAILACFEGFKEAIIDGNGETATNFVDQNTIDYASRILELSITADQETIESLSLIDKTAVLTIRHKSPADLLLQMDGKSLFEYAIAEGLIGKNTIIASEIKNITTEDNKGQGEYFVGSENTDMKIGFTKEDENWKLDVISILPVQEEAFQKMLDASGDTDEDYLLYFLETLTGEKPSDSIWNPIETIEG